MPQLDAYLSFNGYDAETMLRLVAASKLAPTNTHQTSHGA